LCADYVLGEKRKQRLALLESIVETSRAREVKEVNESPYRSPAKEPHNIASVFSLGMIVPLTKEQTQKEAPSNDAIAQSNLVSRPEGQTQTMAAEMYADEPLISSQSEAGAANGMFALENEDTLAELLQLPMVQKLGLKTIVLAGLELISSKENSAVNTQISNSDPSPGADPQVSQQFSVGIPLVPFHPTIDITTGILLRRHPNNEAYYHNARMIGLSLEQVIKPNCLSPFTTSFSAPHSTWDTLPSDLRPTHSQLHFPHHPFIDLIPFPWFRDRVISISMLDPMPFSRLELKVDILNGGLVCWKSRARASGQPWDQRSWEAAPWFLEKWAWLVEASFPSIK